MQNSRWLNPSQPQTLVNACLLLYITAVLDLIFAGALFAGGIGLLLVGGKVAAGWGIANERKWGYGVGLGIAILAVLPLVVYIATHGRLPLSGVVNSAFDILLLGLLAHSQSREYQRIWFK